MMRKSQFISIILILMLLIAQTGTTYAQKKNKSKGTKSESKESLQAKRDRLLEEIQLNKQILEKTQKDKTNNLNVVKSLQNQIHIREEMINEYQAEINNLESNIHDNTRTLTHLNNHLDDLKQEYAKILRNTYKTNSSYNRLMFLFSAKSFNDAYKRFLYLKQYAKHRERQVRLISNTTNSISNKMKTLSEQKEDKSSLLIEQTHEKDHLEDQKKDKDKMVSVLKSQENKLRKDIKTKQSKAKQLNATIENIIKKEIEAARKKAEEDRKKLAEIKEKGSSITTKSEVKSTSTSKATPTLTPEAAALSVSFSNNHGSLPWPVEKGVITEYFGSHPHPALDGVTTNNNGVDINTEKGSHVRAIFDGVVSSVVSNPSFQNAVIIKHGEYFTVYSNIINVNVKAGDNVKTKQKIGSAYTDTNGDTEIHLEIWRGTTKLNPSSWIYR